MLVPRGVAQQTQHSPKVRGNHSTCIRRGKLRRITSESILEHFFISLLLASCPFLMDGDYKQAKEAFVSGTTGSDITHVNLIVAVGLVRSP